MIVVAQQKDKVYMISSGVHTLIDIQVTEDNRFSIGINCVSFAEYDTHAKAKAALSRLTCALVNGDKVYEFRG